MTLRALLLGLLLGWAVLAHAADPPPITVYAASDLAFALKDIAALFEKATGTKVVLVLGSTGNPGEPAAELLRAFGIHPDPQGSEQVAQAKDERLAELRRAMFGNP